MAALETCDASLAQCVYTLARARSGVQRVVVAAVGLILLLLPLDQ
jgi:hypothetical protein